MEALKKEGSVTAEDRILETSLFQGFTEDEVQGMLSCLSARTASYKKGEFIFYMGDLISSVGMVLHGSVQVIREDVWGNCQILAKMGEGQLFGESYACSGKEPLMVSVVALQESKILFMDVRKMLTVCSSACQFHSRLIQNLLSVMAGRNLILTAKIDHISQKTIREKVMSYLSWQSKKLGSPSVEIPFNRQQLADYLAVDRSALSAELSKMRKEGLIEYERNYFTLIRQV